MASSIKIILHDRNENAKTEQQTSVKDLFLTELGFGGISGWTPNTDIFETPEKFVIRLELAGINAEEINLTLKNRELIIRGSRIEKNHPGRVYYHQMEISYGYFEKVILLPPQVRDYEIEAAMNQGILEIVTWKHDQVREIAIQTNEL